MKKHYFALPLIALVLSMVFPVVSARADLIFPPSDSFYDNNARDCVYVNRDYYSNGKEGYVTFLSEPGGREVEKRKNGEIFWIQFTYDKNGETWGVAEFDSDITPGQVTGWVPLKQMEAVYDYISFEEDHKNEISQYTDDYQLPTGTSEIILWKWPGSGEIAVKMPFLDSPWQTAVNSYIDSAGREWLQMQYYAGYRNTWLCLDDPDNPDIPAFNPAPSPVLYAPVDTLPVDVQQPESGSSPLVLAVILVIVVVAAAVALILILYRRKKAE